MAKEQKLEVSLLALDVQKAFDNISHHRLIHVLRTKQIPTRIVSWVKNFLENRSITVRVGHYTSTSHNIEVGIPQGSPLSPLLYLFYNSDY